MESRCFSDKRRLGQDNAGKRVGSRKFGTEMALGNSIMRSQKADQRILRRCQGGGCNLEKNCFRWIWFFPGWSLGAGHLLMHFFNAQFNCRVFRPSLVTHAIESNVDVSSSPEAPYRLRFKLIFFGGIGQHIFARECLSIKFSMKAPVGA